MFQIINKRKYTYVASITLIFLSAFVLGKWGLKLGIDFQGGTLMEVEFASEQQNDEVKIDNPENGEAQKTGIQDAEDVDKKPAEIPSSQQVQEALSEFNLNSLNVQQSGDARAIIRYVESEEATNEKVFNRIKELNGDARQIRVDFVGASISGQLKNNAIEALILAIIGIALYIAWAFRKVSFPISSWQYGLGAVIALAHDIILTLGVFAVMGHFWGIEVGVSFVAALLTILGYSVNDTIVVYDRTRENLMRSGSKINFEQIVNQSLNETLGRSINTSMTVIIVLLAIIFFGGESIKYFAVALLAGITFGTYSSIFVASALLVTSYKYKSLKH